MVSVGELKGAQLVIVEVHVDWKSWAAVLQARQRLEKEGIEWLGWITRLLGKRSRLQ